NGHIEIVKTLLKNGANVNIIDDKYTALNWAAKNSHIDIVKILIRHGANVNAIDKDKYTVLDRVAEKGHIEIIKALIERKAIVSRNALYLAAKEGHTEAHSILHYAAKNEHVEVVKTLLEHGAQGIHRRCCKKYQIDNINAADTNGKTALHLSAENGHKDIVEILINYQADISIGDKNDKTSLHLATKNDHTAIVNKLINNKAEVDTIDKDNHTPLFYAAESGSEKLIDILIKYNAKVNNISVLHKAAENSKPAAVETLLRYNADIKISNKNGETTLHKAAFYGYREVVKILIKYKADDKAVNKNNWTLLHFAAAEGHTNNGHLGVVKHLQKKGANFYVKNKYGWMPLHIAAIYCQVKIFKSLNVNLYYLTKDLIKRLDHLETEFKSDNDFDFFYQFLSKYIENFTKHLDKKKNDKKKNFPQCKKVLSYLYICTFTKICNFKSALESNLIIDIDGYFDVIENNIKLLQKSSKQDATHINIIYNYIQDYDQLKLADYISNINLSKGTETMDEELKNAIERLELKIRTNIILWHFKKAIDALKQWIFLYACMYPDVLSPPLDYTSNGVNKIIEKIKNLRSKVQEHYVFINNRKDKYLMDKEFNSEYESSEPFFIWKNKKYDNEISKLLNGEKVIINADIRESNPEKSAIKFNEIDIRLKSIDKTLQNEIDNELKCFNITIVHLGKSYYRYKDRFYVIRNDEQSIEYSFEKNKNWRAS
ncbi:28328_t:CDS:2, partial [Dentiscutata erythropus]